MRNAKATLSRITSSIQVVGLNGLWTMIKSIIIDRQSYTRFIFLS